MKKIFITGISGTGKTTIAKELEKKGVYTIDVDEVEGLCTWIDKNRGQKASDDAILNDEFVSNHEWVCSVPQLIELMNKGDDVVVILGSPSNQKDFLHLFDKVLLLQCPPEVFIERIEMRTNNEFGKDKTAQKLILGWYEDFEKEMLDIGAIPIDATQPTDDVVEQVLKKIQL
ncbi:MAG: hypothetical protein COV70_02100 [Parcubacteria group bacterium CG11_big_fil_rev_8_21_14_0_20_39_22]|nr:MAG: hypothetical protein COV70_02100 [Parcubacteria group bacterium CG11_big_fil_rev_8_21_14_0_20_39_22]